MKLALLIVLALAGFSAAAQKENVYKDSLVLHSSQSWVLDSIVVREGYAPGYNFTKGSTLLFNRQDGSGTIQPLHKSHKPFRWSIENKQSFVVLHMNFSISYEIEFLQVKGKNYMRLRDEIGSMKNNPVTEYYFIKSH
jgi:hypothetical protein